MIKLERTEVLNVEGALRGMRNPHESWDNADSTSIPYGFGESMFEVGEADHELALRLAKAGSDHAKFLRQIFISVDITAPLYWWKEMDTYKIGTVSNSTSTMHKLSSRFLREEDFSWDDEDEEVFDGTERQEYLLYLNKRIHHMQSENVINSTDLYRKLWRRLVQDLPCSFNQKRTWTANYEVLRNIYHSRQFHKLNEWRKFCEWIETLPCSEFITTPRLNNTVIESV